MKKKFGGAAVLAMCFATAVLTLALVSLGFYVRFGGGEGLAFINKLNTVREIVDSRFVEDVDWGAVSDAAAEGIVASINDRWSYYMTADQYRSYQERSTNTSTGIGVRVSADPEGRGVLVESVVSGSPADRAGIGPGCLIIRAAGQELEGLSVGEVAAIIKAQTGTYSIVFLDRGGAEHSADIRNELVYSSPVEYSMLDEGIGYIRITDFESGAAEDGIAAIEALRAENARALIFDVRSNPGGQLTELIGLLDYILPEGELFVSVDSDGGEEIFYSDSDCVDLPMAVLINADSYSAAEFFAAALREYDRAAVVGEASTGKGRSQQTFLLSDGSAVHISTRRYLTPNRVDLSQTGGLVPDIETALSGGEDTQLRAAVEYLS